MGKEQVMLGIDGTLADLHMNGDWLYQPKWDGDRAKIVYINGKVMIIARSGTDWSTRLPELVEAAGNVAFSARAKTFVIDGEIVCFKDGHTNVRMSNSRCATKDPQKIRLVLRRSMPVQYMAFDVMEWNGTRLEAEPFRRRCSMLLDLIPEDPKIKLTPTYTDPDECWTDWVIHRHEEGVMLKNTESTYVYDRSPSWVKVKARDKGTFHVVGYTAGEGNRADLFGALIIEDDLGRLRGRCGGGFTHEEAARILQVLKAAEPMDAPFTEADVGLPYTPVKTSMQVQVAFQASTNYSDNGKLRSPQLIGWTA
jgi:bifunctional non-homologous end joining protein LigD